MEKDYTKKDTAFQNEIVTIVWEICQTNQLLCQGVGSKRQLCSKIRVIISQGNDLKFRDKLVISLFLWIFAAHVICFGEEEDGLLFFAVDVLRVFERSRTD